uniref:CKK domain-containing protein n=1 Tax=Macrostomum lignano TaxID=282301 RepID=A0A1I8F5U7_9PLAT
SIEAAPLTARAGLAAQTSCCDQHQTADQKQTELIVKGDFQRAPSAPDSSAAARPPTQTGRTCTSCGAAGLLGGSTPEAAKWCIEYLLHYMARDPTSEGRGAGQHGGAPGGQAHCGDCERQADKTRKRLLKMTDLDDRTAMEAIQLAFKNLASADSCDLPDAEGRTVADGNPDLDSVDLWVGPPGAAGRPHLCASNMFSGNCLHLAASGGNFVGSFISGGGWRSGECPPNLNSSTAADAGGCLIGRRAPVGAALLAAGADWSLKDWKGANSAGLGQGAQEQRPGRAAAGPAIPPHLGQQTSARPQRIRRGVHEVLTDYIRLPLRCQTIQLPVAAAAISRCRDDSQAKELESAKIVLFCAAALDGLPAWRDFYRQQASDEAVYLRTYTAQICSALSYNATGRERRSRDSVYFFAKGHAELLIAPELLSPDDPALVRGYSRKIGTSRAFGCQCYQMAHRVRDPTPPL